MIPCGTVLTRQLHSLTFWAFCLGLANRAVPQTMNESFPERPTWFLDFVLPSSRRFYARNRDFGGPSSVQTQVARHQAIAICTLTGGLRREASNFRRALLFRMFKPCSARLAVSSLKEIGEKILQIVDRLLTIPIRDSA